MISVNDTNDITIANLTLDGNLKAQTSVYPHGIHVSGHNHKQ